RRAAQTRFSSGARLSKWRKKRIGDPMRGSLKSPIQHCPARLFKRFPRRFLPGQSSVYVVAIGSPTAKRVCGTKSKAFNSLIISMKLNIERDEALFCLRSLILKRLSDQIVAYPEG